MTYKFNWLNDGLEITDPEVEFKTLASWDKDTKIGVVMAVLTIPGAIFNVELTNISLPTVNDGTMASKGQERLNDYLV